MKPTYQPLLPLQDQLQGCPHVSIPELMNGLAEPATFTHTGDSMWPVLTPGDILFLVPMHLTQFGAPWCGGIYVWRYRVGAFVDTVGEPRWHHSGLITARLRLTGTSRILLNGKGEQVDAFDPIDPERSWEPIAHATAVLKHL